MRTHPCLRPLRLVAGLFVLAAAARADVPVVADVPRPAFLVLQKLAQTAGVSEGPVLDQSTWSDEQRRTAQQMRRQQHDQRQRELLAAVADPDWFSASKRAFIQAVAADGRFLVEVHPRPRPGFKPAPIRLGGRLTPEYHDRLRALLPPPFPADGGPADWLAHGREGWKALLAHAGASPAQRDAAVAALAAHLRPFAARSRTDNQFKPLTDELTRLADLAKVHAGDVPPAPLRAAVLTRALLFAAAQSAASAAQPAVPAFVYARFEVQPADRQHLPFADAAAPSPGAAK